MKVVNAAGEGEGDRESGWELFEHMEDGFWGLMRGRYMKKEELMGSLLVIDVG